jgi:hypothetical protein
MQCTFKPEISKSRSRSPRSFDQHLRRKTPEQAQKKPKPSKEELKQRYEAFMDRQEFWAKKHKARMTQLVQSH